MAGQGETCDCEFFAVPSISVNQYLCQHSARTFGDIDQIGVSNLKSSDEMAEQNELCDRQGVRWDALEQVLIAPQRNSYDRLDLTRPKLEIGLNVAPSFLGEPRDIVKADRGGQIS
jgi:hypothetical protein